MPVCKLDTEVFVYYRNMNREHTPIRYARCLYLASVSHSPHAQLADISWKIVTVPSCSLGISNWHQSLLEPYLRVTECTTCYLQANTSTFCLQSCVGTYKPASHIKLFGVGECSHMNLRLLESWLSWGLWLHIQSLWFSIMTINTALHSFPGQTKRQHQWTTYLPPLLCH